MFHNKINDRELHKKCKLSNVLREHVSISSLLFEKYVKHHITCCNSKMKLFLLQDIDPTILT